MRITLSPFSFENTQRFFSRVALPFGLALSHASFGAGGTGCPPPILSCPPNVVQECGSVDLSTNVTGSATAVSPCDCPLTLVFSDQTAPGCGNTVVVTRTWRAEDDCGNVTTCSQTISVVDTTPPVVVGILPDRLVHCLGEIDPAIPPQVQDNGCGDGSNLNFELFTISQLSPQNCSRIVRYLWRITDSCGNATLVAQTYFVLDRLAPTVVCPPEMTMMGDADCRAVVPALVPTITDNCGAGVTLAQSPPAGTWVEGPGPTLVTLTGTDACGNESSCDVSLTVTCPTNRISIDATVYPGTDGGASCEGVDFLQTTNSTPLVFCYKITNDGLMPLSGIELSEGASGAPALPIGNLAAGESILVSTSGLLTHDFTNTASVVGYPLLGPPVVDADETVVDQIAPSIEIQTTVRFGRDAVCPGNEFILAVHGFYNTFCCEVTNSGDVALVDLELFNEDLSTEPLYIGDLAAGAVTNLKFSLRPEGSLTNLVRVSGHPPMGSPVADEDPAITSVIDGLQLTKTVYAGHDGGAGCPGEDEIALPEAGLPVTYCFRLEYFLDGLYLTDSGDDSLGLTSIFDRGPLSYTNHLERYAEAVIHESHTIANPTSSNAARLINP